MVQAQKSGLFIAVQKLVLWISARRQNIENLERDYKHCQYSHHTQNCLCFQLYFTLSLYVYFWLLSILHFLHCLLPLSEALFSLQRQGGGALWRPYLG